MASQEIILSHHILNTYLPTQCDAVRTHWSEIITPAQ